MDEGSDSTSTSNSSSPPALPPKNRFLSTDNLSPSPPPALPPKRPSTNLNKRLSISTVCINSSESDCLTDGSVAERIKSFMNKATTSGGSTTELHLSSKQPLAKIRPRRSMMDLSLENEDSSATEEKPKGKIGDLPKELPSVRNLASIFTKKSPEPLPRKSIAKVSKLLYHLKKQTDDFLFFFYRNPRKRLKS